MTTDSVPAHNEAYTPTPHEIARALYLMGWSPREALKAYIDAKGPLYDPAERITDKEPDA